MIGVRWSRTMRDEVFDLLDNPIERKLLLPDDNRKLKLPPRDGFALAWASPVASTSNKQSDAAVASDFKIRHFISKSPSRRKCFISRLTVAGFRWYQQRKRTAFVTATKCRYDGRGERELATCNQQKSSADTIAVRCRIRSQAGKRPR